MSKRWAFASVAGLACAGFLAVFAARTGGSADASQAAADGFGVETPSEAPQPTQPESFSMLRDAVASGPLVMGARFVPPPPALSPAFGPGALKSPRPSRTPGRAKKQGPARGLWETLRSLFKAGGR